MNPVDTSAPVGGDYRRYNSPQNQHQTSNAPDYHGATGKQGRTTDLHKACSSPSSSLSKLRATLLALGKSSAATRDQNGALPLHLLGKNELLIHLFLNQARYDLSMGDSYGLGLDDYGYSNGNIMMDDLNSVGQYSATNNASNMNLMGGSGATRPPRTELDSFVVELVRANPRAIVTPDGNGRIPLVDAIYDWIEFSSKDGPITSNQENDAEQGPANANPSNLGMGSARGGNKNNITQVSNLGSDKLDGMSALMGQQDGKILEGSAYTGKRSVLDNVSLPSAFRSAYSASGNVDIDNVQSRAVYRSTGTALEDPAERQAAEFRNTWSAAVPRPDGPSDEGRRNGNNSLGGPSRGQQSGAARSVGQSDILSNPPEDAAIDDVFPLNLAMPPVVEWSLRMISILLDGIESFDGPLGVDESEAFSSWREGTPSTGEGLTSGDSSWIGNTLVAAVASIPSFMKTLLLLNDADPVKYRVFNLSIVRRVISSKYTIGNWLVYMLEAVDPIVARRGVDYLEILSEDEDENTLIPSTKRMRFAGTQLTPVQRAALYYKVSKLDYFLPAILALEETAEVDRASKTKLLRHILDKELGTRATLTMAFFDLFFLMMLLVTFQISVNHVVEGGAHNAEYATAYFLSMIATVYAILRKFGQMSSMIKISRQAFVENNFRWVDGIDWLAILLVIGGIVWMEVAISDLYQNVEVTDYMRSYLAAAICSIWLKVVSWLSVINWQVINLVNLCREVRV